MNPDDFPELQSIIARNSSCYFISRAFRARNHSEFLPLHKIEDLFQGNTRMLVDLCQTLLKRNMDQEAKGVWLRNNLALNAPPDLEADIKRINYQPGLDK